MDYTAGRPEYAEREGIPPMMDDYYSVIIPLRHGTFRGEVRNVLVGSVVRCSHEHRTRSAALRCAEKLFANLDVADDAE